MIRTSLILLPLLLAGCGLFRGASMPAVPGLMPYRIDIQQGNVITREMLAKLQPGMTRSQVRFVLGTPLLVDPFRADRWDYVYFLDKRGDRAEQRQLRVFFKDDRMIRVEGDLALDAKSGDTKAGDAKAASPASRPQPKPEAAAAVPAAPAVAPAAPATTARDPDAAANVKPQLRLAPSAGEPASPEDRAAAATPPPEAKPATPDNLEAPPLPRLTLPPETTDSPASANVPGAPARP